MEHKLETNQYNNFDAIVADVQLVVDNCRQYNPPETVYAKCARTVEKWLKQQTADRKKNGR